MGMCLDEIQVVNIPSLASINVINVSNAILLEKWDGSAAFADPLWLIATIEYM